MAAMRICRFIRCLLEGWGFCRPRRRPRVLILGGSAGVITTMLNKNPGDAFVLTAIYKDPKGVSVPLASLPTIREVNNAMAVLPTLGAGATVSDAQFQFSGAVPTDTPVGTTFTFEIAAEGDPTPGVDTITGQFAVGVVADEDTTVEITGA